MVGWGGVLGFLLMLMTGMQMNISQPLVAVFLLSGIVGTSRLILGAHTPGEIYAGLTVGILSQAIAYAIVG
jgi:membrane-associated phospholipid phosphatase